MTIDYHKKYLKYKKKYLETKKMYGGVSKIEGGGFGLGQGNQGQDKKDWKGGWRFRPKGKLPKSGVPNPSTAIEIELWEYLWAHGLLPNNVQKEISDFLATDEGRNRNRHWVPDWLNKMLYTDTIEDFPEIIRKVASEEAIYIMNSLTKILQNRIKEEEVKFKEQESFAGHIQIINDYTVIYDKCVVIMNNKNLFNGIEEQQKNGKKGTNRYYDVKLYTGPWREGVEQAKIDKKKDIKVQKEAADIVEKKKNLGSEPKKSSRKNKVLEKMTEMFHKDNSKTKISKGEAKKFKKEEEEKYLAHKENTFMTWVDRIISDDADYSKTDRDILINMWDNKLLEFINWDLEPTRADRKKIKDMVQEIVEDKERKKKRKELKKQRHDVSNTLKRIIKDKLENNENTEEEIYKVVEEKWKEISGHEVPEFENTEKLRSFFDKIIKDFKKEDSGSVGKYQLRSAESPHPEWKYLALDDESIEKSESSSMPKFLSQHPERKYLALNDEPQNDELEGAAPSDWVVPTRTLTSSNSSKGKGKGNGKSSKSSKKSSDKKKKKI